MTLLETPRLWVPATADEETRRRVSSSCPLFGLYAEKWLASRTDLRASAFQHYEYLTHSYLVPRFGRYPLDQVTPSMVRDYWSENLAPKPSIATHGYRVLRMIFNRAIEDGLVEQNPCKIRAGGADRSPERAIASPEEVAVMTELMPERLRVVVLLAAYCQLRRGEIFGLQREDVDLARKMLSVRRSIVHLSRGGRTVNPPKTPSSRRVIAVPPHLVPVLQGHLDRFVAPGRTAWLVTGMRSSQPISERTWLGHWHVARKAIGRDDLHLHDLRHSGATWAAGLGIPVRDLMGRLGHSTPTMAIHYQHASSAQDEKAAERLSLLAGWKPEEPS